MKAGRKIRVPRDCEKTDTDLNETRTLSKQKRIGFRTCLDEKPPQTSVKCGIQPSKVEQDFFSKAQAGVFS